MESNGYGQVRGDFQSDKLMTARDIQPLGAGVSGPKSVPPMDVSMRALGQNIERLQQAVQVLSAKLDPVLYPEPPSPATTQAVEARAPRASSSLGSSVNAFADQIESLTDRVQSMTRRCEL